MRRRLGIFLPIVVLALLAQIFAPIGACWAYSAVMADPLRAAELCKPGNSSGDSSGSQTVMHDCCGACALAHAPATPPEPQMYAVAPSQQVRTLAWRQIDDACARQQRDRNAQARAPPHIS